jgi:plasmid stabilization system protein ParE
VPLSMSCGGIFAKVQLLGEHPRLGQRYEPIAYLIVHETRIDVLGVFHASMDIEWYLR